MELVYIGLIILMAFALFSLAVVLPRQLRDILEKLDMIIDIMKEKR